MMKHPGTPLHRRVTAIHEVGEGLATIEMTPPHPPREETPIYRRAHQLLIHEHDSPCLVCGVRQSTLHNPEQNPAGAEAMETHHYPIERSLAEACDWRKVQSKLWPHVMDQASFEAMIDSPANLIVLCNIHHRDREQGIHHLSTQDWAILPYLKDGYQIAATREDAEATLQKDRALLEEEGEHGSN